MAILSVFLAFRFYTQLVAGGVSQLGIPTQRVTMLTVYYDLTVHWYPQRANQTVLTGGTQDSTWKTWIDCFVMF